MKEQSVRRLYARLLQVNLLAIEGAEVHRDHQEPQGGLQGLAGVASKVQPRTLVVLIIAGQEVVNG